MTEPHPLFPTENEDDEPIEVGWIHVTRFEGGGQKWAPRLFGAAELDSLETITELYGGGTYELVARGNDRRSITGRRRYSLPGAPRSLLGEEETQQHAPPPMPVHHAGGSNDAILLAVLQMMAQQAQSNTQLMIAMMTKGDAAAKEHVQTMASLHDRFAQGQQQLFATMLEASRAPAGGGGEGSFIKGIEFAQELAAGIREAQGEGEGGGDLKELLEGMQLFMQMDAQRQQLELERIRAGRQPPPKREPQGPPPNGSAEA